MEARKMIIFEEKKESGDYSAMIPDGAPLAHVYEFAVNFLSESVRMIKEHAEQVKHLEKKEEDSEVVEHSLEEDL